MKENEGDGMKNISKSGRQLVAMMIALAGLIGSPTLSVYSQPSIAVERLVRCGGAEPNCRDTSN